MSRGRRRELAFSLFVLTAAAGCTDAATRIAEDLELGAGRLRHSAATTETVDHIPQPTPEGCPASYTSN